MAILGRHPRVAAVAGLSGRRGAAVRGLRVGAPVRRQRAGLQPARALAGGRDRHRRAPARRRLGRPVALVRDRVPAVLARRPLHLQLSAPDRRGGAVPVARGRGVRARLPRPDDGAADPRAAAQPGARPRRRDRLADHHARPRAGLVDRADPAVPARRRALDGGQARLDRLPDRRHPAARGGDPARPSTRARAGRRSTCWSLEHRGAARHRLRLRPGHPRGRLRRPGVARRRLAQLLPAVGRGGAPPVDGATSSRRRRTATRG